MKPTRFLLAFLVAFGLAACGGGTPTASDADLSPRFDKGGTYGSGGHTEGTGGVMSSDPTPPPPAPGDTTSIVAGGWIGSGT